MIQKEEDCSLSHNLTKGKSNGDYKLDDDRSCSFPNNAAVQPTSITRRQIKTMMKSSQSGNDNTGTHDKKRKIFRLRQRNTNNNNNNNTTDRHCSCRTIKNKKWVPCPVPDSLRRKNMVSPHASGTTSSSSQLPSPVVKKSSSSSSSSSALSPTTSIVSSSCSDKKNTILLGDCSGTKMNVDNNSSSSGGGMRTTKKKKMTMKKTVINNNNKNSCTPELPNQTKTVRFANMVLVHEYIIPKNRNKNNQNDQDCEDAKSCCRAHRRKEEHRYHGGSSLSLYFSEEELYNIRLSCMDLIDDYVKATTEQHRHQQQDGTVAVKPLLTTTSTDPKQQLLLPLLQNLRGLECHLPHICQTRLELKQHVWKAVLYNQRNQRSRDNDKNKKKRVHPKNATKNVTSTTMIDHFVGFCSHKHQVASATASSIAYNQGLQDQKDAMQIHQETSDSSDDLVL